MLTVRSAAKAPPAFRYGFRWPSAASCRRSTSPCRRASASSRRPSDARVAAPSDASTVSASRAADYAGAAFGAHMRENRV